MPSSKGGFLRNNERNSFKSLPPDSPAWGTTFYKNDEVDLWDETSTIASDDSISTPHLRSSAQGDDSLDDSGENTRYSEVVLSPQAMMEPAGDRVVKSLILRSPGARCLFFVRGTLFMTAEKRRDGLKALKTTCNYRICIAPSPRDRHLIDEIVTAELRHSSSKPLTLGKLRGNIRGSSFTAYDDGLKKRHAAGILHERKELLQVRFRKSQGGGSRLVSVLLPDTLCVSGDCFAMPSTSLSQRDANGGGGVSAFEDFKAIEVATGLGARGTKIFGRSPSLQNNLRLFPRDTSSTAGEPSLLFEQVGPQTWTLEFTGPFSPFQAFCASIASLESDYF